MPAFNCTDRSSEFSDAAACCGAAVLDHAGRPVGAISAAGPAERMEPIFARIAPIVASIAEAISAVSATHRDKAKTMGTNGAGYPPRYR